MAKVIEYETLSKLRDELNALLGDAPAATPSKKSTSTKKTADEGDEEDFSNLSYNDLKKLAKSRGVSASGSRDEIIARLNGADEAEEEDEEEPVKKPTRGKSSGKKSAPAEEEEDEEDDDGDDEDDEEDVQAQVEAATAEMSLEELAEFCEDNGLSSKGKRAALISRIVKAVEDGDIELTDDDEEEEEEEEEEKPAPKGKKSKKSEPVEDDTDDEDEDDDADEEEGEPTEERIAAVKEYEKTTRAQFKKGELERDDLIEFLSDFNDEPKGTFKKKSDKEIVDAYIKASSLLINDEGEIVEEGAYTVNGVPYCCGRPLTYDDESGMYVCEHCGEEYEADEE